MDADKISGLYTQKQPGVQVITPDQRPYVVLRQDESGNVDIVDVVLGPKELNADKLAKWTRRGFVGASLGALYGIYHAKVEDHLRDLGYAVNTLGDLGTNVRTLTEDTVKQIIGRVHLEDRLSEYDASVDMSRVLLDKFKTMYENQHTLIEVARRVCTDYDTFSKEMNTFVEKTPVERIKHTAYHDVAKEIYDGAQKLLTGRDTGNPDYIRNFDALRTKNKDLADAIRGLETKLNESIDQRQPAADVEKMMRDYLQVVAAQQELRSLARDKGIQNIVQEELRQVDAQLEQQLGPDYTKYIDAFRKNRKIDMSKALPIAGAVVFLGLGYAYAVGPASRWAVGPLTRVAAGAGKAKQAYSRRQFLNGLIGKYESPQPHAEDAQTTDQTIDGIDGKEGPK